jgi:hypothetical protein
VHAAAGVGVRRGSNSRSVDQRAQAVREMLLQACGTAHSVTHLHTLSRCVDLSHVATCTRVMITVVATRMGPTRARIADDGATRAGELRRGNDNRIGQHDQTQV